MRSEDREVQATVVPESLPWVSLPEEVAKWLAQQVAEQIKIESVEPPPGERETQIFFTESALGALGCSVPEGLGRYMDLSAPMVPDAQAFVLTSGSGCQVDLLNLVQRNDGSTGLWAGLRANAMGDARRRGYETEMREGHVGERSELRIFSENGAYRGFWYAIESADVLYLLRIYSEHIQVSLELESLLRAKLALTAN